jgi:hypothetical protein
MQQNQLRFYSLLKNSRSRRVLKGLGFSRAARIAKSKRLLAAGTNCAKRLLH